MKITTNGIELTVDNKSVMLNARQMHLFTLLLASKKVVFQNVLMQQMGIQSAHTLVQHVSTLKAKLKAFDGVEIVTQPKVGYQLKI